MNIASEKTAPASASGGDAAVWFTPAVVVLLLAAAWGEAQVEGKPDVHVSGVAMEINGINAIAPGMFGVHATGTTDAQLTEWGVAAQRKIHQDPLKDTLLSRSDRAMLQCLYDRYQPALQLTDPDWRQTLAALARRFEPRGDTQPAMIEFWNEPYLNWSTKPGVNYDGDHYDTARAVEGGPVHYRGSDEGIPDLVWTKGPMAVRAETGAKDYLAWGYMPRHLKEGDTYDFRGKTKMRVESRWLVKDTSQKSYWAGRHNVRLYNQMLETFAPALKQANPNATLVAGWDFHYYQGNWDGWFTCLKPTIDAAHQWIDGVTEHHYGGDTRHVAVQYEVATGYTLSTHGKFIRNFNTEAGGNLDPQRPDTVTYGQQPTARARAHSAMTYHLRDVVYLLARCPDKAAFRAAHEPEHNGGDEFAFKMLKDLRGRLIETTSRSHDVWAVSSLDDGRLAVVVFNDLSHEVTQTLRVHAPAGATLSGGSQKQVHVFDDTPHLRIAETRFDVIGTSWAGRITLPPKSAIAMTFTLAGEAKPRVQTRRQSFASNVIEKIEIGQPTAFAIELPGGAKPAAAVLRVCSLSAIPADIAAQFNGKPIAVPSVSGVIDIPLDPQDLRPQNTLVIHPGATSFQIASVSLFVVSEE
jgi:hypothetical protein